MYQAIRDFGKDLTRADIGLFYFAGHGMQVEGVNYLIPVGADIQAEVEVRFSAIDANLVLAMMERAGTGTNILILDACRDNPFARSFRSSSRGLAVMDAPSGSLIVYATAPGSVAADGTGRNGIFTGAFLHHMKTPGVDVEDMLRDVRRDVMAETAKEQVPWSASSLTASFYFAGESGPGQMAVKTEDKPTASFSVEHAYSSVNIEVKTNGMLYLDGTRQGPIPTGATATLTDLEVGNHELEMRYDDGEREIKSVVIERNRTVRVAFSYVKQLRETAGFVLVDPGTYQMGAEGLLVNMIPVHSITISKAFYMSKCEVTQKQWRDVMSTDKTSSNGDNLPVVMVSWYDAVEFCNRLSLKEGLTPCYNLDRTANRGMTNDYFVLVGGQKEQVKVKCDFSASGYRLPTEAEWEYVARGGNKSRNSMYAGSNWVDEVAWYDGNSAARIHEVGQKRPNELGLHDMSGSVWEWCWDWYSERYYSSSPSIDPCGPSRGSYRIMRGGGWDSEEGLMRVAVRGFQIPSYKSNSIGFRVVRTAK
jgi:formylglycine-generating enzyme required for sulfatase activity